MTTVDILYATCSEYSPERKYPGRDKTLYYSLKNYEYLDNSIGNIVIIRAYDKYIVPEYYDFTTLSSEIIDKIIYYNTPNSIFSMGQWCKYIDNAIINNTLSDYYLLLEDDYTFDIDHFDDKLIQLYTERFPSHIGFLSSITLASPITHWDGFGLVSRKTIERVYNKFGFLYTHLSRLVGAHALTNGGACQLEFSRMFSDAGVETKSIVDKYKFFYWCDYNYHIRLYTEKTDTTSIKLPIIQLCELRNKHLVQQLIYKPIQLIRKCVLVVSFHRSFTSLFSRLLFHLGIDYGLSKTTVMDQFNKYGYYENERILYFNERVLKAIGSSWKESKRYTEEQHNTMMTFLPELSNIIQEEFAKDIIFFIKDPRIILLFPLYEKVLLQNFILGYPIQVVRPSDQVQKSLQRAQNVLPHEFTEIYNNYMDILSEILNINTSITIPGEKIFQNLPDVVSSVSHFIDKTLSCQILDGIVDDSCVHYK